MKISKQYVRKYHPEIIKQLRGEIKRDPSFKAQIAKIKTGDSVSAVRRAVQKKAGIKTS